MLPADLGTELDRLTEEVLALGRILDSAILEATDALSLPAGHGAQSATAQGEPLITLDHLLAKKRFAIEMDCLGLIVMQQPTGGDLRTLTAVLEIVTELEHIGRHLSDIAQIHVLIFTLDDVFLDLLAAIRVMAAETEELLQQALKAFVERDIDLARAVHARDRRVNAQYHKVYGQVLRYMSGRSRTRIKQARYLGEIARNLERTADRVTNICEWVVFASTGVMYMGDRQAVDAYQEEGK